MNEILDALARLSDRDRVGAFLAFLGVLLLAGVALFVWAALTSWEFDECLRVGHTKTYCDAQAAGCFDGRNR